MTTHIFHVMLDNNQIKNLRDAATIEYIQSQLMTQIDELESEPQKMIGNLHQMLMDAHDDDKDRRFKCWSKRIDSVDQSQTNGYAFNGEFVPDRDTEFKAKSGLYLAMLGMGSAKYNHQYYQVIYMDAQGNLYPTEITTDTEDDRSWAIRIRDQTAELLRCLPLVEINDDGYAVINENLQYGITQK